MNASQPRAKPRALDLFCGAGGATKGLQRAGFYVVGVDIKPQPRYCGDEFVQADALGLSLAYIRSFDFGWASPPCQRYSLLAYRTGTRDKHQDAIPPTRIFLIETGIPWVIENVQGAPVDRMLMLCGTMFDLGIPEAQLWRHRFFEANFVLMNGRHCQHRGSPVGVYGGGGDWRRFGVVTVTGHSGGIRKRGNLQQYNVLQRRQAMGIDWMTNAELSESIPPAYSEFIGKQALQFIERISVVSDSNKAICISDSGKPSADSASGETIASCSEGRSTC